MDPSRIRLEDDRFGLIGASFRPGNRAAYVGRSGDDHAWSVGIYVTAEDDIQTVEIDDHGAKSSRMLTPGELFEGMEVLAAPGPETFLIVGTFTLMGMELSATGAGTAHDFAELLRGAADDHGWRLPLHLVGHPRELQLSAQGRDILRQTAESLERDGSAMTSLSAARRLELSEQALDSIRRRISRTSLQAYRMHGRWYVVLDNLARSRTSAEAVTPAPSIAEATAVEVTAASPVEELNETEIADEAAATEPYVAEEPVEFEDAAATEPVPEPAGEVSSAGDLAAFAGGETEATEIPDEEIEEPGVEYVPVDAMSPVESMAEHSESELSEIAASEVDVEAVDEPVVAFEDETEVVAVVAEPEAGPVDEDVAVVAESEPELVGEPAVMDEYRAAATPAAPASRTGEITTEPPEDVVDETVAEPEPDTQNLGEIAAEATDETAEQSAEATTDEEAESAAEPEEIVAVAPEFTLEEDAEPASDAVADEDAESAPETAAEEDWDVLAEESAAEELEAVVGAESLDEEVMAVVAEPPAGEAATETESTSERLVEAFAPVAVETEADQEIEAEPGIEAEPEIVAEPAIEEEPAIDEVATEFSETADEPISASEVDVELATIEPAPEETAGIEAEPAIEENHVEPTQATEDVLSEAAAEAQPEEETPDAVQAEHEPLDEELSDQANAPATELEADVAAVADLPQVEEPVVAAEVADLNGNIQAEVTEQSDQLISESTAEPVTATEIAPDVSDAAEAVIETDGSSPEAEVEERSDELIAETVVPQAQVTEFLNQYGELVIETGISGAAAEQTVEPEALAPEEAGIEFMESGVDGTSVDQDEVEPPLDVAAAESSDQGTPEPEVVVAEEVVEPVVASDETDEPIVTADKTGEPEAATDEVVEAAQEPAEENESEPPSDDAATGNAATGGQSATSFFADAKSQAGGSATSQPPRPTAAPTDLDLALHLRGEVAFLRQQSREKDRQIGVWGEGAKWLQPFVDQIRSLEKQVERLGELQVQRENDRISDLISERDMLRERLAALESRINAAQSTPTQPAVHRRSWFQRMMGPE